MNKSSLCVFTVLQHIHSCANTGHIRFLFFCVYTVIRQLVAQVADLGMFVYSACYTVTVVK